MSEKLKVSVEGRRFVRLIKPDESKIVDGATFTFQNGSLPIKVDYVSGIKNAQLNGRWTWTDEGETKHGTTRDAWNFIRNSLRKELVSKSLNSLKQSGVGI